MIETIPTPYALTKSIISEVAEKHGVAPEDILGGSRLKKYTRPRHECMTRLYQDRPRLSLPAIGKLFNRHHTTVLYAIEAHARRAAGSRLPHGRNRGRFKAAAALRMAHAS
jgi:chromosomal replication initiator protein